jgi:hypothetical protein
VSTETTTGRVNGSTPADPAQLRAEISRTRSDLGETAAALAAKTDVRARMRAKAAGFAEVARVRAAETAQVARRPVPVAIIAAIASAATVAALLIRRSRR